MAKVWVVDKVVYGTAHGSRVLRQCGMESTQSEQICTQPLPQIKPGTHTDIPIDCRRTFSTDQLPSLSPNETKVLKL